GIYFDHIGVWDEMLRVPLVVWAPGRVRAERRRGPASGLDVAPTLLRLAGLTPPAAMEGVDLLADAPRHAPVVAEAVRGEQLTLRDGDWKFVRTFKGDYVNDTFHPETGDMEVYDLAADPSEHANLASTRPDVTRTLAASLDAWL